MIVEKLEDAPSPREALAALAAGRRPFLLESSEPDAEVGRYSFAGVDPFLTLVARGRRIEVVEQGKREVSTGDPFQALRRRLGAFNLPPETTPVPFPAGAVGFFAYDLGRQLEHLPVCAADDLELPDLCLDFHDAVITWDHLTGETWVTSTGLPAEGAAAGRRARRRADDLLDRVRAAVPPEKEPASSRPESLRSTFSRRAYVEVVARAKKLIAAGDIYQVNLSQRFRAASAESGRAIYDRLARTNPASFAAYLTAPCGAEVVSASPERFLLVEGDRVETRPIKGTRPRGAGPEQDRRLAAELLASEKDRAELVMIVDLLRNDLGRVARFGSVEVTEFPALTRHPTVHHLHGTVKARLAAGRDSIDLLRAAFPGGSITGAPKVRAMEIIETFEPVRRGVYAGSIGYLSFQGRMDLNIAIRTLVKKNGVVTFSVGGGIVADSDPEKEYEETLHKGRGLGAALGFEL